MYCSAMSSLLAVGNFVLQAYAGADFQVEFGDQEAEIDEP